MAKKLGVALGAGAAWGAASIGVLKVLEEENITPSFLSGSSIGAIIGAVYASQFAGSDTLNEAAKEFSGLRLRHGFKINSQNSYGLFSAEEIKNRLEKLFGKINFEDLKIPLTIITTDFRTGEEVHLNSGAVAEAVAASCSIPFLFTPYKYQGRLLIDGGVTNPTPVDVLKKMGADITLAVALTMRSPEEKPPQVAESQSYSNFLRLIPPFRYLTSRRMIQTFWQMLDIFFNNLNKTKFSQTPPDILLIPKVHQYSAFDFKRVPFFIEEGEKSVREILPKLKRMMS